MATGFQRDGARETDEAEGGEEAMVMRLRGPRFAVVVILLDVGLFAVTGRIDWFLYGSIAAFLAILAREVVGL